MRRAWLGACLVQLGCNQLLGLEAPVASHDASDFAGCVDVSTVCASADVLRTCTTIGGTASDEVCAWGCSESDGAHCMALQPSGGVIDVEALSPDAALADIVLAGPATLDTDTGSITGVREAGPGIVSGIDFTLVDSAGIFRVASLTIDGPLLLRGTRSAVIVSNGAVDIRALVDVRGSCVATESGPGGFDGGMAGTSAAGSGFGGGGGISDTRGGGGGGHGDAGASGGFMGGAAAAGGTAFGDDAITVLSGGGGGGGGGDDNGGGGGGGGGGALQIVSNAAVTIAAAGVINAGGCGGRASTGTDSGGGGGAGGTVLLEAPTVSIAGTIAVNGGGGGAGRGGPGAPGDASRTPAAGGAPDNSGAGGDGAAGAQAATAGTSSGECGGGGGGIGRIRINTKSGTVTPVPGAVMSPSLDDSPTTATSGPASAR